MEGARSGGETTSGQVSDGEGNRGVDYAPARGSEDGGESRVVRISMEGGEDGEDKEGVVNQELQRRLLLRRICPAVLAQMLLTAAVVLTVNYGLESFVHANMKEIFACEILAVALICAAGLCCTLRLGTSWPCCVIYLIVPSVSFGVIFGVISVVYADADSFLVAAGFACGFFFIANLAFAWLATGKHYVNPNGWLFSFGEVAPSSDWSVAALSIYFDFAFIFVLSLMLLGVRHEDDRV